MSIAYVDSSVLVGLGFGEAAARREAKRMLKFSRVVTGSLAEAEFESAISREATPLQVDPFVGVSLVTVGTSLRDEIRLVLEAGYVRGADCWHLAAATYLAPKRDLTFLTLDKAQRAVAKSLGFAV